MRRSNALLLIATGLLALGALAGPAHAWYPKAAQAETATRGEQGHVRRQ